MELLPNKIPGIIKSPRDKGFHFSRACVGKNLSAVHPLFRRRCLHLFRRSLLPAAKITVHLTVPVDTVFLIAGEYHRRQTRARVKCTRQARPCAASAPVVPLACGRQQRTPAQRTLTTKSPSDQELNRQNRNRKQVIGMVLKYNVHRGDAVKIYFQHKDMEVSQ